LREILTTGHSELQSMLWKQLLPSLMQLVRKSPKKCANRTGSKTVAKSESDDDKEDRNAIGNGKSVVNVTKATALLQMRRRPERSNCWF